MNRLLFACCLVFTLLISSPAGAQQYLHLDYDCNQPSAGFSHVYVLNHRTKHLPLGFIKTGIMNRIERVAFNGSLPDSLALYFQPAGAQAGNGRDLVFILDELFMSEQDLPPTDGDVLKLSVALFVRNKEGRFSPLLTVDSTITLSSGIDVTQKLLRSVSNNFCGIAGMAAAAQPDTTVSYSMDELRNLDSLEMLRLPAAGNKPRQGIYRSYQSFKNNTPDAPVAITFDTVKGNYVVYQTEQTGNGKLKKTHVQKSRAVYAVSDGEHVLKYFEDRWHELSQTTSGFYFDSWTAYAYNAALWDGRRNIIAGITLAGPNAHRPAFVYRFKLNNRTGRPMLADVLE